MDNPTKKFNLEYSIILLDSEKKEYDKQTSEIKEITIKPDSRMTDVEFSLKDGERTLFEYEPTKEHMIRIFALVKQWK